MFRGGFTISGRERVLVCLGTILLLVLSLPFLSSLSADVSQGSPVQLFVSGEWASS